jgi:hypothetical protein
MPTPRSKQLDPDRGGLYHCISRCVRHAYLCGIHPEDGRDLQHRKNWIRKRLAELEPCFCIGLAGYAVMSNHIHLVLRTEPQQAASDPTKRSPAVGSPSSRPNAKDSASRPPCRRSPPPAPTATGSPSAAAGSRTSAFFSLSQRAHRPMGQRRGGGDRKILGGAV